MTWVRQLVLDLQEKLDQVLVNAKNIYAASSGNIEGEYFKNLEMEQKDLFSQLMKLNETLCSSSGVDWYTQVPLSNLQIQSKIKTIQDYMKKFVDNMEIRKGLLRLEIQDINKTKSSFSKMKTHYAKPVKTISNLKINTLS
jgi:hypothetical protein